MHNFDAAPPEFKCEVARVELREDGTPVHTFLTNPSYPRGVRFSTVAGALESASRDTLNRASTTDYDVWGNGWKSGENPARYRFLPDGKQIES
jgi:hypothetical protein